MPITLHPIAEADAAEVLQFELETRAFFGRFIAGVDNGFRYPDAAERFLEGCAES